MTGLHWVVVVGIAPDLGHGLGEGAHEKVQSTVAELMVILKLYKSCEILTVATELSMCWTGPLSAHQREPA